MLKLLIVDKRMLLAEALRDRLRTSLNAHVEFCDSAHEVAELLEQRGPFDLILIGCTKPGAIEIEFVESLSTAADTQIAILCDRMPNRVLQKLLNMRVSGFVKTTMRMGQLEQALRVIADGEIYIPPEYVRERLLTQDAGYPYSLTEREYQILTLLAQGDTNSSIATELDISIPIVKADARSICIKLGTKNRTQAALKAITEGLV